jgi:hypothetical protein
VKKNEYGWTQVAHVVFIDQPVGTGFSYVTPDRSPTAKGFAQDEKQVGENMYQALLNFFTKFPEHKNRKLFIAGESYAGHYIPAIADRIVQANLDPAQQNLNLAGVAIGDGLTDAIIQRLVQTDQAYYAGLIGYDQRQQLNTIQAKCAQWIQQGNTIERGSPCESMSRFLSTASGDLNYYDIRSIDDSFDGEATANYLNRLDVQKSVHVIPADQQQPIKFERCNGVVYENLKADILISFKQVIVNLTQYIRVLLFAGNFDLKDGPVGVEQFLMTLDLPGFKQAPRDLWLVNGRLAGYVKDDGHNFTFATVFGAGHYVPTNQPVNSLDMIDRFMNHKPYCTPAKDTLKRSAIPKKALTPHERFALGNEEEVSCRVSQVLCEKVLNNCYGHGSCVNGACVCNDTFVGEACAYRLIPLGSNGYDKQEALQPQDWLYYQLSPFKSNSDVQVTLQVKGKGKPTSTLQPADYDYAVGDGLGMVAPRRTCLYGRKNEVPTWLKYDFVQCTESLDTSISFAFTSQGGERLYLGVYNGVPSVLTTSLSFGGSSFLGQWQFWIVTLFVIAGTAVATAIVTAVVVTFIRRRKEANYGRIEE